MNKEAVLKYIERYISDGFTPILSLNNGENIPVHYDTTIRFFNSFVSVKSGEEIIKCDYLDIKDIIL